MIKSLIITSIVATMLFMAYASNVLAQDVTEANDKPSIVLDDELEWADYEPEGFGPGLRTAVVYGDPSVPDEPYVIRASFIDGYEIPAHYHPRAENLTVLSGTFMLAMGEQRDDSKLKSYTAGDFLFLPGEHPHFGFTEGETVIQLHGIGPFETVVLEGIAGAQE